MTAVDISAPLRGTSARVPDARLDDASASGRHRRSGAARGIAFWAVARQVVRAITGLLLTVAALGSIALTIVIALGHIGFSPVLSPSMRPSFAPGDLVITKPEPAADVRVGQVVMLPVPGERGERYVHRVIEVGYQKGLPVVRTKGDANSVPENFRLTITSRTVPVVVHTVPHMGKLAILLRGGAWRIAAIIVVGALLMVGLKRALLDR